MVRARKMGVRAAALLSVDAAAGCLVIEQVKGASLLQLLTCPDPPPSSSTPEPRGLEDPEESPTPHPAPAPSQSLLAVTATAAGGPLQPPGLSLHISTSPAARIGLAQLLSAMGRQLALLHDSGQLHGSLSLRNVVVCEGEQGLAWLDWSRSLTSTQPEAKASELQQLEAECLRLQQPAMPDTFDLILASYKQHSKQWSAVTNRLASARKRAAAAQLPVAKAKVSRVVKPEPAPCLTAPAQEAAK